MFSMYIHIRMYARRRSTFRRRKPRVYRRSRRTRYTRRPTRRGRNIGNMVKASLPTIPQRLFTKLRYCDVVTASVTAGVLNSLPYFKTSIYAPRSSGGHQPLYYDQWAAIYHRYCVYGIKWSATCVNHATDEAFWFGIRQQDNATAETSLQTLLERGDCKIGMGSSRNSGRNTVFVKGYMSTRKATGVTKYTVSGDNEWSANIDNDPASMAYLFPYILTNAGSTTTFEITYRLTYYVQMFNPLSVTAS